ncbi:hypothetical protein SH449x_002896 [Pirellulaceae bacterium SH449]
MSLVEQRDFILLAMGSPFGLGQDYWQQVSEQIESRLGVAVGLCAEETDDPQSFWTGLWVRLAQQRITRLLVITIDQRSSVLQTMRDALAWHAASENGKPVGYEIGIQFSRGWDEVDWAETLAGSPYAYSHAWRLTAVLSNPSLEREYATQRKWISGIVWEMRRLGLDTDYVILDKRYEAIYPSTPYVKLPWLHENGAAEQVDLNAFEQDLQIVETHRTQSVAFSDIVFPEAWAHVIVKKYLEGIKYCTVRGAGEDFSDSLGNQGDSWDLGYQELLFRMEELLPSEYRGTTNDVSPSSMGSARIESGPDGKVAWDKIWTSFCDLALAGGPPHRGRLLEAVTSEACSNDPEKYQAVVAEIERGIKLVTGLNTVRSQVLGWVGIECDDQLMAAWLMRAIIVENVMVRREGHVLYLPAGPDFQVTKEIKNVITSVAKTVHYWREH